MAQNDRRNVATVPCLDGRAAATGDPLFTERPLAWCIAAAPAAIVIAGLLATAAWVACLLWLAFVLLRWALV